MLRNQIPDISRTWCQLCITIHRILPGSFPGSLFFIILGSFTTARSFIIARSIIARSIIARLVILIRNASLRGINGVNAARGIAFAVTHDHLKLSCFLKIVLNSNRKNARVRLYSWMVWWMHLGTFSCDWDALVQCPTVISGDIMYIVLHLFSKEFCLLKQCFRSIPITFRYQIKI